MSSVLLSLVQLGCVCMLALLSINQTKKITKLDQELTDERFKNLGYLTLSVVLDNHTTSL